MIKKILLLTLILDRVSGCIFKDTYLPATVWSCGWAAAVFLCERRSDPPELELGRLDIGTSLLKGHTLSRHYHSLK